jgi:hypothetical protein
MNGGVPRTLVLGMHGEGSAGGELPQAAGAFVHALPEVSVGELREGCIVASKSGSVIRNKKRELTESLSPVAGKEVHD